MSDLIVRLLRPLPRKSLGVVLDETAIAQDRAEAAAALKAQAEEIERLRARLAAMEAVVEAVEQLKLARKATRASLHVSDEDWIALCAKEKEAVLSLEHALAAYNVVKEKNDAR